MARPVRHHAILFPLRETPASLAMVAEQQQEKKQESLARSQEILPAE